METKRGKYIGKRKTLIINDNKVSSNKQDICGLFLYLQKKKIKRKLYPSISKKYIFLFCNIWI